MADSNVEEYLEKIVDGDDEGVPVIPGSRVEQLLQRAIDNGISGSGGTGAAGKDGISPIVTITDIEGGHRVTITDAAHPSGQFFDVMDGEDGAAGSGGSVTVDSSLSLLSQNPVKNSVVTAALNQKQAKLIFDAEPTENSDNPVTSGGVYGALSTAGGVSDWEQNDPEAKDYIKNRPFYSEPVYTNYLNATTEAKSAPSYPSQDIDGAVPRVYYNLINRSGQSSASVTQPSYLASNAYYEIVIDGVSIGSFKPSSPIAFTYYTANSASRYDRIQSGNVDDISYISAITESLSCYIVNRHTTQAYSMDGTYYAFSEWYVFLSDSENSHTITIRRQSSTRDIKIPSKYIDSSAYAPGFSNGSYVTTSSSFNGSNDYLLFGNSSGYRRVLLSTILEFIDYSHYSKRYIDDSINDIYSSLNDLHSSYVSITKKVASYETLKTELRSQISELQSEVANLKSRVSYLESLHTNEEQNYTAAVNDGILELDGDGITVQDNILEIPYATVVDKILTFTNSKTTATISDGILESDGFSIDNNILEVQDATVVNGILTFEGSSVSASVNDNLLETSGFTIEDNLLSVSGLLVNNGILEV